MRKLNSYINESLYINKNGEAISSVLEKFNTYNRNIVNGIVNESEEVLSLTEQQACYELLEYMCVEGLGDALKQIYNTAKDKIQQGIDAATIKVKKIREFLDTVKNKGIKTIKDLVEKVTEMLQLLNCSIKDFFTNIGFDESEAKEGFKNAVEEALKDKAVINGNAYESLSKEDKKDIGSRVWKNMKQILLQLMGSYATSVLLPAIIVCVGGPAAIPVAALVEIISKGFWSSRILWSIIKGEIKYRKDGIYDKLPEWGKILHDIFFIAIIVFCLTGVASATQGLIDTCLKGFMSQVPSEAVSGLSSTLSDIFGTLNKVPHPGWDAAGEIVSDATSKSIKPGFIKAFIKLGRDEQTIETVVKSALNIE